jgi:thiamine-monophosphate kinase
VVREFALLEHIYAGNHALPERVLIRPGDDMGALRVDGSQVLVTVDQVADGVHFDLSRDPLEKAGRKAITRNLSDVAAMACRPIGAVAAACLPRDFGEDRATRLFDVMRNAAASYDCPLIGGDIAVWDHPLILTVTVLAQPYPGVAPVLRKGARAGDVVCVTGRLGGSLETIDGVTHHLDFEPRLKLALTIAARYQPHCMIDLSDGLARDVGHLAAAAEDLTAELQIQSLPLSPAALAAAQRDGRPAWEHALGDGEDYELCFTVSGSQATILPAQIDGVPITQVGRMVPLSGSGGGTGSSGPRVVLRMPDGTVRPAGNLGWEHAGA